MHLKVQTELFRKAISKASFNNSKAQSFNKNLQRKRGKLHLPPRRKNARRASRAVQGLRQFQAKNNGLSELPRALESGSKSADKHPRRRKQRRRRRNGGSKDKRGNFN